MKIYKVYKFRLYLKVNLYKENIIYKLDDLKKDLANLKIDKFINYICLL